MALFDNDNITIEDQPAQVEAYSLSLGYEAEDVITWGLHPVDTSLIWGLKIASTGGSGGRAILYLKVLENVTTTPVDALVVQSGETLTLRGQTFTAVDDPDQPAEFYTTVGSPTGNELVAQSLINAINNNPILSALYTASYAEIGTDGYVQIQAIEEGTSLNWTVGDTFVTTTDWQLGTNYSLFNATDTDRGQKLRDFAYATFVRIYVSRQEQELFVDSPPPGAAYKLVSVLRKPYAGTDTVYYDIHKYLANEVSIPLPRAAGLAFVDVPEAVKTYYLEYGEEFDGGYSVTGTAPEDYEPDDENNTLVQQYVCGRSEIRHCAPGAFEEQNRITAFARYWLSFYQSDDYNEYTDVTPLTDQPGVGANFEVIGNYAKVVQPDGSFEPLYFYAADDRGGGFTSYRIRAAIIQNDLTSSTHILATQTTTLSTLYYISPTPQEVATQAGIPIENIQRYTLQVEREVYNPNTGELEFTDIASQRYDLVKRPARDCDVPLVEIYWRNRFRCYDHFTFAGGKILSHEIESVDYERSPVQRYGYHRDKGQYRRYKQKAYFTVEASSGWVDDQHYKWLQSLLLSDDVYQLVWKDIPNAHASKLGELSDFTDIQLSVFGKDFESASGEQPQNPAAFGGYNRLESVRIEDSSWAIDETEGLYNLTLTYRIAFDINTQQQ
jgi:hypothetical protein